MLTGRSYFCLDVQVGTVLSAAKLEDVQGRVLRKELEHAWLLAPPSGACPNPPNRRNPRRSTGGLVGGFDRSRCLLGGRVSRFPPPPSRHAPVHRVASVPAPP